MPGRLDVSFATLDFEALAGEGGPYLYAKAETEALEADGVDGRRYRQKGRRHQPFRRTGLIGAANKAAAEALCDKAARMSGVVGTLDDGRGWRGKVFAELESCRPFAAPLSGPSGSYAAHAVMEWQFTVVEDGDASPR